MIHSSSQYADSNVLQLKTCGQVCDCICTYVCTCITNITYLPAYTIPQPITYQRVVRARIPSNEAHIRTVAGRSQRMAEIRNIVAGTSSNALSTQLTFEVNWASRQSLLQEAGSE